MKYGDAILNEKQMGLIIPPPEIRKIIDKAAELVGRYGSSIEATFQNEDKNLPKFSFLKDGDPYRPYYLQKANEIAKENANKSISEKVKSSNDFTDNKSDKLLGRKIGKEQMDAYSLNTSDGGARKNSQFQEELRKIIEEKKMNKYLSNEIKAPPKDLFSISHPNISSLDMDIIKNTAQFVARNGQKFLSGLSEREVRNPQFDFLKPQHNLFGYFTYLVESYAKCLRKDDVNKASIYFNDREEVLKKASERYLWEKKQKEILRKKDKIDENERNIMAQIDWYDFTIVEVIEFTEEEMSNTVPIISENDTTVNMNINSIEANVNIIMNLNKNNIMLNLTTSNEEEKISEMVKPIAKDLLKPQIAEFEELPEPGMKIVKNYKRKVADTTQKKDIVKCPLCKESISIDDWPQHIKIELLDPKWREIQKELTDRKIEMSLAPTSDFINYLSEFSRYRPDLFGDVKDVVKIEEIRKIEAKAPNTIWDGIASNINRTTANIAMLFQQNRKNIEESMKVEGTTAANRGNNPMISNISIEQESSISNRSNLGYINPSVGSAGQPHPFSNSIPLYVSKQNPKLKIPSQNPSNQSQNFGKIISNNRESNSRLLPEDVYLLKNDKPFKLNIKLPFKTEINKNFKGQIITITVDPKDLISSLKNRLKKDYSENGNFYEITLKNLNDIILEDHKSFAFYNLSNNSFIELDV
jgi:splicing factor 3A subunit 1